MVENVSNNMSKVKNIEVQPITTCSYKKKECIGFSLVFISYLLRRRLSFFESFKVRFFVLFCIITLLLNKRWVSDKNYKKQFKPILT